MKKPISECMLSSSMMVPHDDLVNDALARSTTDKGLQPNNLTIEEMRANAEFYQPMDELDRVGVASQTSGRLSGDVVKAVNTIKSAQFDRNKPKNSI